MTNEKFETCDTCKRILYYVPAPPKPDNGDAKSKVASETTSAASDENNIG